ncbi:hypothetical protein SPI_09397 [Niveomyces insectorum RCEF 264]|uniref:Uncharacterized protein n=1 Tax=Niveomyces insectorum RCEF 264 TaxID=1081102 RepID=A0A167LT33_9HYPO|nr:hypothetical protein SPI_09397 [Niveomyces insectorum RCEF 264]
MIVTGVATGNGGTDTTIDAVPRGKGVGDAAAASAARSRYAMIWKHIVGKTERNESYAAENMRYPDGAPGPWYARLGSPSFAYAARKRKRGGTG